ncbi:HAD family hydrolase [Campylobacter sp. MIT 12-5580]|uniref:HAD family hydrolase n=1 Tax=Campylobacter sp. MIT 12-5580 TaxID=2040651 RepID=UPI0010F80B8F|nr:HAD family hydrolase [Campylobacter sp. MIT 12-5580]TKX28822.1 HAD family hydrolase [Campylobacter sp. MIT 12-5580]
MINVIFDMDGTLINSANAISSAVNEIRADLKLAPLEPRFIMQTINTPGKDWAKILYDIDKFEHSSFKDGFERYFIKHYQKSVLLYDGVIEVLEFLKSKNCYLAIATNAPQSSLTQILNKHNILPFFSKVLGVSLGIEPKPHPMMLKLISDEAPFEKSVFVGDSDKDKQAAQNANMPYFHAKWGEEKCQKDEFKNADELIELLRTQMKA